MDLNTLLIKVSVSLFLIYSLKLLISLYNTLIVKPKKLRSVLKKQGIDGPPATFLIGNALEFKKIKQTIAKASTTESPISHKIDEVLFPFFQEWQKQYGELFTFSIGDSQNLHITRSDIVKEIITCTSLDLGRPTEGNSLKALIGEGIIATSGTVWASQRKILAPHFHFDKVKGMMTTIQECAEIVIDSWKDEINEAKSGTADINIEPYLRSFSGDVISKACFASNYSAGEEIFSNIRALFENVSENVLFNRIPGMRHIPVKSNRESWSLEKKVRSLILQVVKERKEARCENDLLQTIVEAAKNSKWSQDLMDTFVVDNFKNIYLAAYETTAVSAEWCLMLLALHQEWQDRVREEVFQICKGQVPDADMIRRMKQLPMVIAEAMRLYPPVAFIAREAYKDITLGNIFIPKGLSTWLTVPILHTHPQAWGPNSYEFKPERFENGVAGACKNPHFYMPFGAGLRVCLGQNLALLELKILISMILSQFSVSLSPRYVHSPTFSLVVEPKHGVNLLVKKL